MKKKYKLQEGQLELDEEDLKIYEKLFKPAGVSKDVGNGEVSLYWLFNEKYGGLYKTEENRGGSNPDLKIGEKFAEVKSYQRHNGLIKLGRCESNYRARKIINTVSSCYNFFYANLLDEKDFVSEIKLGIKELTRAFSACLELLKTHGLNELNCVLNQKEFLDITTPDDYAARTFAMLAEDKLREKPGLNHFIVNTRPDIIGDIKVYKVKNIDEINLETIKKNGARMRGSELEIKLSSMEG